MYIWVMNEHKRFPNPSMSSNTPPQGISNPSLTQNAVHHSLEAHDLPNLLQTLSSQKDSISKCAHSTHTHSYGPLRTATTRWDGRRAQRSPNTHRKPHIIIIIISLSVNVIRRTISGRTACCRPSSTSTHQSERVGQPTSQQASKPTPPAEHTNSA